MSETIKNPESSETPRNDTRNEWDTLKEIPFNGDRVNYSEQAEQEKQQFEVVSFAEIATELADPRYEELGHGTTSVENARGILQEGLNVGGPGRDTDIDSNFVYLANNNPDKLRDSIENWEHKDADYIVLYRIPFEYKIPSANMQGAETYSMFYEPKDNDSNANSGKYNKDFAFAYIDVNTGLVYKNNKYKGNLDDPDQKAEMENKYQFLRNETANKIIDPEDREGFLAMAENWHEMGESMMPKQSEQAEHISNPEMDNQKIESASDDLDAIVERDSGRTKVASGDVSSVYRIEKANGKTSTQIESEYFNLADQFNKTHPDFIKNNLDLNIAMSGLATDLALIDATRGQNLSNTKQAEGLLEDYRTIRTILNAPETSEQDKQTINEYLNLLDGNALNQVRERYDEEQDRQQNFISKENNKEKENFERHLEDLKNDLEKSKGNFSDDFMIFDRTMVAMDELLQSRNRIQNIDEIEDELVKLKKAHEELRTSAMKFLEKNIRYESGIANSSSYLSAQKISGEKQYISDNEDYIENVVRAIGGTDDKIAKIQQYISNIKDELDNLSRW